MRATHPFPKALRALTGSRGIHTHFPASPCPDGIKAHRAPDAASEDGVRGAWYAGVRGARLFELACDGPGTDRALWTAPVRAYCVETGSQPGWITS